ncbi:Ref family recombination enhancement nuclease [Kerstersia gyiorum]|uniref:Ref family recombination enhancement nuclease n=1 Tax=Kerstersia gyiorum TaxID=206506 RepID=UPI0039ECFA9F
MAWNSTFNSTPKPMQRKTQLRAKSLTKKQNRKSGLASRGMKGAAPTAEQKRFHDRLACLGCIACRLDGMHQPVVSIHHIDGRTKPNAHWEVLPLCAGHHQDGTGAPGLIAVHPWKTRFEARYGTQYELLATCLQLTKTCPATVGAVPGGVQRMEVAE